MYLIFLDSIDAILLDGRTVENKGKLIQLTQYKVNWREHIQRMDDNRLPRKNLNYKPEGRRNIGRQQTRCEDDFREEGKCQEA